MKKKLLAVMLCMMICVVGLPFTASAAEVLEDEFIYPHNAYSAHNTRSCDCDASQLLVNYPVNREVVATYGLKDKCCRVYYSVVRVQCSKCKQLYDEYDVYETITTHTYASNGKCTICDYWRASK